MKKLSNIKVVRMALSLIILLSLTITPAFAEIKDANKDSNKKDEIVEPKAVYDGGFWFTPLSARALTTFYAEGEQFLWTYAIADGHLEMLLDPHFNRPSVAARQGVPNNSFSYTYHPAWAGNCWVYDSGAQWYTGNYYMYLKASTSSAYTGTHSGMQGSDVYVPDLWYYENIEIYE